MKGGSECALQTWADDFPPSLGFIARGMKLRAEYRSFQSCFPAPASQDFMSFS